MRGGGSYRRGSSSLSRCQIRSHSSARTCTEMLGSNIVSPSRRSSSHQHSGVGRFKALQVRVRRLLGTQQHRTHPRTIAGSFDFQTRTNFDHDSCDNIIAHLVNEPKEGFGRKQGWKATRPHMSSKSRQTGGIDLYWKRPCCRPRKTFKSWSWTQDQKKWPRPLDTESSTCLEGFDLKTKCWTLTAATRPLLTSLPDRTQT